MGTRIGIDLGTTYSVVAAINAATGKPFIVRNAFGDSTTPSAICLLHDGDYLWGEEAKAEYDADNPNAAAFYKRNMGEEGFARTIAGKDYTPTDFSAMFLRKLVEEVEQELGDCVDGAIISVPAYFAHKQVQATVDASRQAGINLLGTVHEPTAAAFAYGLDKANETKTVLFYDLGGGTFDVTIAKISGNGIDVLGSAGDHNLGGKDWDDAITRFFVDQLLEEYDVDLSAYPDKQAIIQGQAEQIKKQLTAKDTVNTTVRIDNQSYQLSITRDDFADISESLCDRTGDIIDSLFDDLDLNWSGIDSIIPVGGSTKMPMINDYLARLSSVPVEKGVNADEAVAMGAAIKANLDEQNRLMIGGSSASSSARAISFRVTDVVAHSLGMLATNTSGDCYVNSVIIPKKSKIPISKTKPHLFHASARNTEMEVYVLQGEEERPLDNIIVNKYVIEDIRPTEVSSGPKRGIFSRKSNQAPSGEQIDVTYSYDIDGLIVVTAHQGDRKLNVRVEDIPDDMSWTDEAPQSISIGQLILAIDLSGSMSGNPIAEARKAMIGFVDQFSGTGAKIGVLLFADNTDLLVVPNDNHEEIKKTISTIDTGMNGVGYCNDAHPFLDNLQLGTGDYMVVLTDGVWSYQGVAIEAARAFHAKGINVIALGFGSADEAFLRKIASVEEFASLTELSNLSASFGKIAQVIQTGGNAISSA